MNKKIRLVLLLIFLIAISAYLSTPYREYIYERNINDYGLADVGGNLFVVTILSIICWLGVFKISNNRILDVLIVTAIYLILEIASYFFPYIGTFDIKDLIVLPFGTLIALWVLYGLERKNFQKYYKDLSHIILELKRIFL